jgi:V-type H+-transporting ATPase subunit H
MEWIDSSLMMHPEHEQRVLLATLLLEHVLRVPQLREDLIARADALKHLATNLIKSRNVQIQYQAIFALWLLTFDVNAAMMLQSHFSLIPALLDVARNAIKEKVVRLIISTWRNYLSKCPNVAVPVMIGAKVLEYLESFSSNKIADEEAAADVAVLKEELVLAYQSLNSFEEYASEIKSGKLEWSPPHKSELFWKDTAAHLADNDFELLRCLNCLLDPSNDPQILAIAASDIGMYVTFHAAGRRNVELLGIKQSIMALISHPDPEVRYQALTAMQKYMKKLWNPA